MNESTVLVGVCLTEQHALELESFAVACGADLEFVRSLVDEGLITPFSSDAGWRFGGEELARARRIQRLQRDFDANLDTVAVMLDLLDEIERLRARLRRAGLSLR
jgi:chaperone modulatory protein CbpM